MGLADLHIHTYYSDSTSSPVEVAEQAAKAGLSTIAITDHDVTDGVEPTREAAKLLGVEVISGIELSCVYEGKEIDILGYMIRLDQGPLFDRCRQYLDGRIARMKQMLMNLKSVGIDNIEFEEIQAMTHSRAVGRPHLAQALLAKGWVTSTKEAFNKYLSNGNVGYAPKFQQTPFEAIDLIHQSGGVAVMAHPMLTQKDELIAPMAKAGLDGIEVYYPNCSDNVTNFYAGLAKKNKILATGGSDAHGAAKVYTHIGKVSIDDIIITQMREICDTYKTN